MFNETVTSISSDLNLTFQFILPCCYCGIKIWADLKLVCTHIITSFLMLYEYHVVIYKLSFWLIENNCSSEMSTCSCKFNILPLNKQKCLQTHENMQDIRCKLTHQNLTANKNKNGWLTLYQFVKKNSIN